MIFLPVIALAVFLTQLANADFGVSVYGEYSRPSYVTDYSSDRLTSSYRRGYQVDDWIERGDSSVTDSPIYEDGIRLAAWASRYEDDYSYALASAIYFFDIPRDARSIRIKISYSGEGDRGDFNEEIAGRVWIKRSQSGEDYTEYYPDEGRYADFEKPLYGDTFVLRAKKNFEIIRLSARDHVVDDVMELHIAAENGQQIDVKYIEVETYTYLPSVRVVTRYYNDYTWRPWYNYTYWYFYTGPIYHFSDYYYVRYTYPNYRVHYVDIRKRYNHYLTVYHTTYPRHYVSWVHMDRVYKGTNRNWSRDNLDRWTPNHENARRTYKTYSITTTTTSKARITDIQRSRDSVRSVLTTRSRLSPSEVRAQSGISTTSSVTERRQSATIQPRRSVESQTSTDVKSRTEIPGVRRESQPSSTSSANTRSRVESSRTQINESRTPERSAAPERTRVQTESQTETKVRSESTRSTVRTQTSPSNSQTSKEKESAVKGQTERQPSRREASSVQRKSSDTEQQPRREVSSPQPSEKKEPEKKIERRTETQQNQAPARKVETKVESSKKDEDEDEEQKKKQQSSQSSSGTSSSGSTSSSTKVRRGN